MSNSKEENLSGTVFMGPLSYREEQLDTIISAQMRAKWSEETEAKYMESVRTRATTKVRAMLLQAKRRSNEIIEQAEVDATEIRNKAEIAYADLLESQKKVQEEYENSFEIATQNANEAMKEQLIQDQKALGESTAVVLLSIHQQLQNIYDAWREELRLLTLEAIQVGTGWVADSNREKILSSMLDECVSKLIDKKDYIVRVHPSDGALVTQVLENSREKLWSMEVNADLEPGSLEVENTHAMVKNSSKERKEFVQGILENLVLPAARTEGVEVQAVTDTLMNEMQINPLLEQASAEQADALADDQTDELANEQNDNDMQYLGQDMEASPEDGNLDENSLTQTPIAEGEEHEIAEGEEHETNDSLTNSDTLANNDVSVDSDISDTAQADNSTPLDTLENTLEDALPNILENADPAEFSNENTTPQEMNGELNGEQEIDASSIINTDTEAENLVGEFLSDISDDSKLQETSINDSTDNATEDSTGTIPNGIADHPIAHSGDSNGTQNEDSQLPPELADDLLAEMGFSTADSTPK